MQKIIKLLSSETNYKIIKLLSKSDSYPRKIAREIGRSEGVVVRALKSMEKAGILKSAWGVMDERPAKVYTIRPGILFLISDFTSNEFQTIDIDKKYLSFIEKIMERDPDEFCTKTNCLKWSKRAVNLKELGYMLRADEEDVKGFIDFVQKAPRQVFLAASYFRIQHWEKEKDGKLMETVRLNEFVEKTLSKLLTTDPEALEYKNISNWQRKKIDVEGLAKKLDIEKKEAEKFVDYTAEHLGEVYAKFHELKIRRLLASGELHFEKMNDFFTV